MAEITRQKLESLVNKHLTLLRADTDNGGEALMVASSVMYALGLLAAKRSGKPIETLLRDHLEMLIANAPKYRFAMDPMQ